MNQKNKERIALAARFIAEYTVLGAVGALIGVTFTYCALGGHI